VAFIADYDEVYVVVVRVAAATSCRRRSAEEGLGCSTSLGAVQS
jgi:hypothetical protein